MKNMTKIEVTFTDYEPEWVDCGLTTGYCDQNCSNCFYAIVEDKEVLVTSDCYYDDYIFLIEETRCFELNYQSLKVAREYNSQYLIGKSLDGWKIVKMPETEEIFYDKYIIKNCNTKEEAIKEARSLIVS
jgi:hypothetical protein